MRTMTEEIIPVPGLIKGLIRIMTSTATIEGEVVAKRSSEGAKVLARSMTGEERVSPRKMDTRILTTDQILLTTGTGEEGEEVEEISPEETPEYHPLQDHKGVKTQGTVPLKVAGEIPGEILQHSSTAGPTLL